MKRMLLVLTIAISFASCKKEECKSCYVLEGRRNAYDSLIVTETDAGMKCGEEIAAWKKVPWVNTYQYTKVNKCR